MTRKDRYRVLATLPAMLLLLVLLLLGCGGDDEQQDSSGRTGRQSTGAPGQGAKHNFVCGPSWSTVPSEEELTDPRAIAARTKNDIWVVGRGRVDRDAGGISAGAEHWNGSSWSLSSAPNLGVGEHVLDGVDAVARKDVWAVGYSKQRNNRYETLVEHWDGDHWRVVKSPNADTALYNTLTSVDALSSTDAWAVGSYRTDAYRKTLIQRWDGTSWKIVSSPNPATLSNSLLGVAAAGPDDAWAVGWKSSPDGLRSLVLHHDGTTWQEIRVPAFGSGDNVLTSVSAASSDDVWAAGYYVDGAQHRTLTLHYDGSAWERTPSANEGDGVTILRDIEVFSPADAWAVGFAYRADLHHYVASTQHWDGSSWSAFPSAISRDATKETEMSSVAKGTGTSQVWAAGSPANVETICPSGRQDATALPRGTRASPTSVRSSDPTSQGPGPSSETAPASDASAPPISAQGSVRAVDKVADAGIAEKTQTHGAVIADFNNDTNPDIFLGRHTGAARFYRNTGNGHFKETNKGTFVKTDRHGCDAADVNGDRLRDIFCSIGAKHGTSAKRNELYIQRSDHTFAERAAQYGVFDPFGRGRLGAFIDANGDTHPDLFVANEANRGDAMPSPNRFFINQEGSTYRYAPGYGLEREMSAKLHGSDASVEDLDKDGWEDLVLLTSSGLRVYHNDQGRGFTDVAALAGLEQNPRNVTLADVNGDSWSDVIEVSRGKLRVLLNTSGKFSRIFSTDLEYGSSVAAGDVNGDDRPDIYVMRGKDATGDNAPDQVYLNDGDGTSFTRMASIPSTSEGEADFVAPIDYDQNGLTDFLVGNGAGAEGKGGPSKGPLQLIAFFPSS